MSAPLIADHCVSTFRDALTFPEARTRETDRTRDKDGELIVASSDSVRKRLRLLALAPTLPFNCLAARKTARTETAIPIALFRSGFCDILIYICWIFLL